MNVFVDDFRDGPEGWHLCRTIEEAKRVLEHESVECLSLDHDMGACASCVETGKDIGDMQTPETTFCYWCPHHEDGTTLVAWMIETGHWPATKPTVHSANPVGRRRMEQMIESHFPGNMPRGM